MFVFLFLDRRKEYVRHTFNSFPTSCLHQYIKWDPSGSSNIKWCNNAGKQCIYIYLLTPSMFCDNHCQSLVSLFFPYCTVTWDNHLYSASQWEEYRVYRILDMHYIQNGELWAWSLSHCHKQQHYTVVHKHLSLHPLVNHSYDLYSLCCRLCALFH